MTKQEMQQEALSRARGGLALSNYPAVYAGFQEKGIPETDIKPRDNVLTFNAWKALGRQVKRGEHGVKITTWINRTKEVETEDGKTETKAFRYPKNATVFHISQTKEITRQ